MKNWEKELQELNQSQRDAVTTLGCPIRIIAGAGSGKTKVITNKIAYLVTTKKAPSYKICAITFTNKATNEMKTRLLDLIGEESKKVWISTYHALCLRILKEDGHLVDVSNNFSMLDSGESRRILKNIYKKYNWEFDKKEMKQALKYIGKWSNSLTSPENAKNDTDYKWEEKYPIIYREYVEEKKALNVLDFDDLIIYCYILLQKALEVRDKWQDRFDYALVDEFQDTNYLQYEIIKFLFSKKQGITVVGDPDQNIYSWRGAEINIILNFNKDFPNTKTIFLNQNYRSTKAILDISNNIISKNKNRIEKILFSNKSEGTKPIVYSAGNPEDESQWIIRQIKHLRQEKNYTNSDFLILYRSSYLSRWIEEALMYSGIKYRVFGSFRFFDRAEIKDAIALLRVVMHNDHLATLRLLKSTPKIGPKKIQEIEELCKKYKKNIVNFLLDCTEDLNAASQKHLAPLISAIKFGKSQLPITNNLKSFFKELIDKSNLQNNFEDKFEYEKVNNIKELLEHSGEFDKTYGETENSLEQYLDLVSLQTDNEQNNGVDYISLMTIHSAKGLENKVVFLLGVNNDAFPSPRSMESSNDALEEERRAFYVALTRAQELLYISFAGGYSFITKEEKKASIFIQDLNKNHYELVYPTEKEIKNNRTNYSSPQFNSTYSEPIINQTTTTDNAWSINDIVEHPIFGVGSITRIIGLNLEITFPSPYNKRLLRTNSKIIKITDG